MMEQTLINTVSPVKWTPLSFQRHPHPAISSPMAHPPAAEAQQANQTGRFPMPKITQKWQTLFALIAASRHISDH